MDVKTAGRTVDVFEAFAHSRNPMTSAELARALDAPQSSCFNLLRALETRGYLYGVGGGKRLYPTRKLFEIAEAIAGFEPIVPRVQARLDALRDDGGETVILGTRQGQRVAYLAVAESRQAIRFTSRAGALRPLHATAIGKALLTAMPVEARNAMIERLALDATTARTITTAAALSADVAIAAARGFARTMGEHVADVMAVAVPLRLDGGDYAVAIAGPIGRLAPVAAEQAARITRMFADFA